ncbi:MAG: nicotinate-nucleotide adenylyltransferase [Dictyoglomus sp.]|nr:nicotinate-nucleotide adenylyltransferase [Dictyoglomus sp.]MCX7942020.1 nicotinate-nucleotide adenylyltransferase [Dictyoglomaceae bacterium]MDW8188718.1 nicotinate-nucleotide adenylyltransferase [Dictyoglomus sp.]
MSNKIGILGGTFDPIHNGHLWFAESAKENFNLEKIIFIPNKIPPHRNIPLASEIERYEMVLLATINVSYFEVSDIEIRREGRSYIVDTLEEIKNLYRDKEIFLLLGSDAFSQFLSWKNPEKVINLCRLIVGKRGEENFNMDLEDFIEKYKEKILFFDFPYFPISAQEIRERIRMGRSIRYLVPPLVEEYIYKKRLYIL